MAVRGLNGTTGVIECAIASFNPTGAHTLAVLFKRSADNAWHTPIAINSSGGTTQVGMDIRGDNNQLAWAGSGGTVGNAGITALVADGWCIGVVTVSSFAAAPRIHLFKLGGAWQHGIAGSTVGSPSSMAGGKIVFGRFDSGSDFFNGRLAVAGIWNTNLSDLDCEALATGLATSAWTGHTSTPVEVWQFNQASTGTAVTGLMGSTHDQTAITGTSVVTGDDPSGWTFTGAGTDASVTAVPAVSAGSAPVAVVSAGGTSATVTAVPALSAGIAPVAAVRAGGTVTAVAAVSAGSAPPANQIISIVVDAPAVISLGSAPAAAVSAGGTGATVNAVPALSAGSAPVAAVQAGISVTAAVALSAGSAPAAAATQGVTVTAVPAVSTGQAPRPTISPAPVGGAGTAQLAATFAEDAA